MRASRCAGTLTIAAVARSKALTSSMRCTTATGLNPGDIGADAPDDAGVHRQRLEVSLRADR